MSQIRSETVYTKWGGSFTCYNGKAAEIEFIEFVASFARCFRLRLVIETGAGRGFTTRSLVKACPVRSTYIAVESDEVFHSELSGIDDRIEIRTKCPTMAFADLVVLDSVIDNRLAEIDHFTENAKSGTVCIVHDVSERHRKGKIHHRLFEKCRSLKLPQIMLNNPRGGCILTMP